MRYQRFEIAWAVPEHYAADRSPGYYVGNAVSMLFDKIASELFDPGKADLSTLKVELIDGGVRASIYVEDAAYPFSVDRFHLIP